MDINKILQKTKDARADLYKTYRSLLPEKVLIIWSLLFVSFLSFFSLLLIINNRYMITVPVLGGKITEGIIGTPRFINPVLANSEQDNDFVNLVFAGLTKRDSVGSIVLDMAENITESEDGLHYEVTIKDNAYFHDGKKVTSDDIIYTISLIQNTSIKSPSRVKWEGVSVEKKNGKELTFSLKKPYPLFMNALSIGILPKHIWKNLTDEQISLSDYNIKAIGSGPFYIDKITSESGIPKTINLKSNKHYTLGRPYIDEITLITYQNEKYLTQAFKDGEIDRIHGISIEKALSLDVATSTIKSSLLPRTITIFFNSNKADFLSDKKIRNALNLAINKEAILTEVLSGHGKIIDGPYPFDEEDSESEYNTEKARELLSSSKYVKKGSSTLTFNLATANTDEMKKVAEIIKKDWSKIGVNVNISVYEFSDLNQSVIKERDFQALLFGTITESPSDLYAFWHSSQRTYPGLNISNYVSSKLDKQLETLRENSSELDRISAYEMVKKEFEDEVPGIFLFAPSLVYITNDKITSELPYFSLNNSSRFTLVESWYKNTEKIWPKTYYKPLIVKLESFIK